MRFFQGILLPGCSFLPVSESPWRLGRLLVGFSSHHPMFPHQRGGNAIWELIQLCAPIPGVPSSGCAWRG